MPVQYAVISIHYDKGKYQYSWLSSVYTMIKKCKIGKEQYSWVSSVYTMIKKCKIGKDQYR